MGNIDILNVLFKKFEEDELFYFNDAEKDELDSEVTVIDNKITKFIQKELYSKKQKKLKRLLMDYNLALGSYYGKKNELCFKNGVAVGIKIIISALSMKI